MRYRAIVSDWNGTLTTTSEEDANKYIGYGMLADAKKGLPRLGSFLTLGKLAVAKARTKKMLKKYHAKEVPLREVYRQFNLALNGKDAEYVNAFVDEFARSTADKVDPTVLRPIQTAHGSGMTTSILSVAYGRGIEKTLKEAGYLGVFDKIVANRLVVDPNGKVDGGLTLDIYEAKAAVMEKEFLDGLGLTCGNTLYIGDTKDDEPIADLLDRGNFVVPPLATEEFRERLAGKGAFVIESEKDWENYLIKS